MHDDIVRELYGFEHFGDGSRALNVRLRVLKASSGRALALGEEVDDVWSFESSETCKKTCYILHFILPVLSYSSTGNSYSASSSRVLVSDREAARTADTFWIPWTDFTSTSVFFNLHETVSSKR